MQTFQVAGMSCDHCERAVTAAVRGLDPGASVAVDLAAGIVRTDSDAAPERLAQAIEAAGYPVQRLETPA